MALYNFTKFSTLLKNSVCKISWKSVGMSENHAILFDHFECVFGYNWFS